MSTAQMQMFETPVVSKSRRLNLLDPRGSTELREALANGLRARGVDFAFVSDLRRRPRLTMGERRERNPHRLSVQERDLCDDAWSAGWDAQRDADAAAGRRYDRHRLAEAASAAADKALQDLLARRRTIDPRIAMPKLGAGGAK